MRFETKTIKVESGYASAYAERYNRLGYEICDTSETEEDGKKLTAMTMRRDAESPAYPRLLRLEQEVDELCRAAKERAANPDERTRRHRLASWIIFGAGCAIMALGIALTVSGLIINNLALALGGWGCAIVGAALVIAWSFLREKWRLRRVDFLADSQNPGFGTDEYSKKVEECLKQADEALSSLS